MREYLDIGPCPAGEDCSQVGDPDYADRAKRECRAYVNQLRRVFGPEPDGARLTVTAHPHDFGSYHEVVCYYDGPEAEDYAFRLEGESPERWDAEARAELGLAPVVE